MEQDIKYFHSWSGGKDSTASIILDYINHLPPSNIVFIETMFDNKRDISGELPEHIDFIKNKAKPTFEKWGYSVDIIKTKKDYLDLFYHIVKKSKNKDRNGKYRGFLIGGMCSANQELKIPELNRYYKKITNNGSNYMQYVGIAIDEPERLKRLRGTNKISLLEKYGYTEQMAYELCKEFDLLSPTYKISRRGGCWFCPGKSYSEFAYIKTRHPELWEELLELNKESNVVSKGFKYGRTLDVVERKVNKLIEQASYKQSSLFDIIPNQQVSRND